MSSKHWIDSLYKVDGKNEALRSLVTCLYLENTTASEAFLQTNSKECAEQADT